MGNTHYSSPYTIDAELEDEIVAGHLDWEVLRDNYQPTIFVDADRDSSDGHQSSKYRIDFNYTADPNCRLAILFPTHPVEKYRLLWTTDYSDIRKLQKIINRRAQEARGTGSLVMAVGVGKTLFVIENIAGIIYLPSASAVNCINVNHVEAIVNENVPVFVEMNRYGSYRTLFVFPMEDDEMRDHRMSAQDIKNFEMFEPYGAHLFCMEADPRSEKMSEINTMTHGEAEEIVRSTVDRQTVTMDYEQGPYPRELDD